MQKQNPVIKNYILSSQKKIIKADTVSKNIYMCVINGKRCKFVQFMQNV